MPYTDRLAAAMAAADLVVARSGGSVAELAALGKPAILVPYPYATADHQRKNAREMVAGGAALLVDDAELDGALLARLVAELLGDRARLAAMAAASAALGRPDAAQRVADQIEDVLTTRRRREGAMSDDAAKDFPQPVHFIGIGGAGMSGIAAVLARARRRRARLGPQGVALHAAPRRRPASR